MSLGGRLNRRSSRYPIAALLDQWRTRAGSPRKGSAASKLIELLPRQPIVSVATAYAAVGGSAEAVRLALNSLEERGILRQSMAGRYARTWAADELFEILNEYEHSLATPTRASQPPRHAPRVSQPKAAPRS